MARDLIGRFQIGIGRGCFDVGAAGSARRVDVDRDQRLGVIDYQAAPGRQLHFVRVGRFDLILDLIAREQRDVVGIRLELALRIARHVALHVLRRLLEGARIIDQYLADVIGQIVAQ